MKNNVLASGLLVLIGLLLIVSALQMLGWGKGINDLPAETFDVNQLSQLQVDGQSTGARNIDDKLLDAIAEAPLFSRDRLPFVPPEEDPDAEGKDGDDAEEEAKPLQARITSVIITDEYRYAMVLDETTNERLTLQQGMPLPGEQGLWVLAAIEPRKVRFEAEGEEPVELELTVFDGALSGGGNNRGNNKKRNRNNRNNNNNNQTLSRVDEKDKPKNSAEEIRRKIAERRAQMRANAAKGNKNEK